MNPTTLGRMEAEIKDIQTTLTGIQQTTQAVLNAINYAGIPDKDATNSLERIEADVRDVRLTLDNTSPTSSERGGTCQVKAREVTPVTP